MGLDRTQFSPGVRRKVVYAGVASTSYPEASRHLAVPAELPAPPRPVERPVNRIGHERIAQRDAAVATQRRLPLMGKDAVAEAARPGPAVRGLGRRRPGPGALGAGGEIGAGGRANRSVARVDVRSGRTAALPPESEARSAGLGVAPPDRVESDPRRLVSEAGRYLSNDPDRMRYPDDRREGLPIMTGAVESVIKRIDQRVKGSEKSWSGPGAEAILRLRADYLSERRVLDAFWSAREAEAPSGRTYRRAG